MDYTKITLVTLVVVMVLAVVLVLRGKIKNLGVKFLGIFSVNTKTHSSDAVVDSTKADGNILAHNANGNGSAMVRNSMAKGDVSAVVGADVKKN